MNALRILIAIMLLSLILPAQAAEALVPQDVSMLERMKADGLELMKRENYKQAIPILKKVLSFNPADRTVAKYLMIAEQRMMQPYCRRADEQYQGGYYEDAIKEWEMLLNVYPENISAQKLIELTKNMLQDNFLEEAYALVERLLDADDYEMAVDQLEKILLVKPNEERARNLLISTRQTLLNIKINAHYEKAESYFKEKKYDRAITEWEKVLKLDERQEEASRRIASTRRIKLGVMYADGERLFRTGNYLRALSIYNKIIVENPTDQNVKIIIKRLNGVVDVVQKINHIGLEWDMLRKALENHIDIEENLDSAVVASWYAVQLDSQNQLALAIRRFLELEHPLVYRSMEHPVASMNIIEQYLFAALNHIYEGRYDLAIQKSSIVIDLQPNNVLAYKRLGSAYYALGNKDLALKTWKKALKLSPRDKELKAFIKQVR